MKYVVRINGGGGHKVLDKRVRRGGGVGWFSECQVPLDGWGNGAYVDVLVRWVHLWWV